MSQNIEPVLTEVGLLRLFDAWRDHYSGCDASFCKFKQYEGVAEGGSKIYLYK